MATTTKPKKVAAAKKPAVKAEKAVKTVKVSQATKVAKTIKEVKTPKVETPTAVAAETPVAQPAPATKPSKSSPATKFTMAELMQRAGSSLVVAKRGSNVTGKITRITKSVVLVDIGAKTEGIVADKEYTLAREYIESLTEGMTIEAVVASEENQQGQVLLSLRRAVLESKWDFFQKAMDNDEKLDAKGVEINKGGLIVLVNGVRGFVPSSQFGKAYAGKFSELKNKVFPVKVIEVDKDKNRLIFSERHVSEAGEIANKSQALSAIQAGTIYEGTVSGVMHFGLFVTVEVPVPDTETTGQVEGLVHISEISWEKVGHPKEYHKVGDRLKVKVLGVDDKTGKLNLSIKQLSADPWTGIEERYQSGTTLTGVVSRVESFGVFVNVEEGVDGLIHSSKLDPHHNLKKGDTITVHVENVSEQQKRMSLSLVMTELPVEYR